MIVNLTFPQAMRVYIALLRERERQRTTLAGLLERGANPDSFEVQLIADALAETNGCLAVVDTTLYPAPYPTEEALA